MPSGRVPPPPAIKLPGHTLATGYPAFGIVDIPAHHRRYPFMPARPSLPARRHTGVLLGPRLHPDQVYQVTIPRGYSELSARGSEHGHSSPARKETWRIRKLSIGLEARRRRLEGRKRAVGEIWAIIVHENARNESHNTLSVEFPVAQDGPEDFNTTKRRHRFPASVKCNSQKVF